MISLHYRPESAFRLAIVFLSLGLVGSCKTTMPDPRQDLLRSLKGANVEGYHFATEEDETQVIASLTNSAVRNLITLDSGATDLVLRYTSVKDKNTNTTRTSKTEVIKTGTALTLLVTDIATGEVVSRKPFPAAESHKKTDTTGPPPTFDSLEDCIKDFNCTRRGALQCEADRTCENQFAALTCCLKNGQCFSVHLIIRPTRLRCLIAVFPNFEGLVLSQ
ncbi:MAG: hypothetical protein AABN33_11355 [Acidobacteriota bacterium]